VKRQPVSRKRKASSPKASWLSLRRRYTWHLRPPFKSQFDRSHWWKAQSEIEPVAALYELARRHPLVRETWIRSFAAATRSRRGIAIWLPGIRQSWTEKIMRPPAGSAPVPPSLYRTCLFGLKSWAKLDYTDRKNWESCVGYLKGLDFRQGELQCRSINVLAHWRIIDERKDALRKKGQINDNAHAQTHEKWEAAYDKNLSVLHNDLAVNPPTAKEWEAAIGYRAVEAYRQGYLLLAVAPDLQGDKAALLMEKVYRSTRRMYPSPKQRARWQNWLPLITSFEDAEMSHKAYAQQFARYRRALDSLLFA